jgi:hypothetical protein
VFGIILQRKTDRSVSQLRFAIVPCLAALACAPRAQEPQAESSADNTAYAVEYPPQLDYSSRRLEVERESANEGFKQFQEFPAQLGQTDRELVAKLYRAADEEGGAAAYADAQREAATIQRFMAEEEVQLVGRISSSAQYAAKEKECDVAFFGPVQRGLEKGVDKQLEERRRRTSAAQRAITENERALGTKNTERLREQLDRISYASYLVKVGLAQDEYHLKALLDQGQSVRSTLEDQQRQLSAPSQVKQRKRVDTALQQLQTQMTRSQTQLQEAEQKDSKLRDDYDAAFSDLLERLAKQK